MKSNSIFIKIINNNLIIMLIPLLLVVASTCYLMCLGYKNDVRQTMQDYVNEYAGDINAEIENSLQISDYFVNNRELIQKLNGTPNSTYEALVFSKTITNFLDNITNNNRTASITIYCSNDTIFENKYVSRLENLKNYAKIQNRFIEEDMNIIWDNSIIADTKGKYFTFFRNLPLNQGSILACKVYLPELPSYSKNINLTEYNTNIDQSRYVTADIRSMYKVVLEFDFHVIQKQYLLYISIFSGLGLFFIIVIIILSYKVTSKITLNIENFITRMGEEDLLESDINLLSSPNDPIELKIIKKTVDSLITKVKNISDTYYKTELEKRKTELNLLQSKLGPHILYNSLSVIKLNAFEQKDESTIDIIDNLVSYYRTMLNYGNEMIKVSLELEMIKKYVRIYELAHTKNYDLTMDVDEHIKECQILHLILQPFVENAIIHGLAGSRENCKIHISGILEGDYLIFSITDNGYGIPDAKLEALNHLEYYKESYGLKNTYERLKLVYGNDSKIEFVSTLGIGTTVTIRFNTDSH